MKVRYYGPKEEPEVRDVPAVMIVNEGGVTIFKDRDTNVLLMVPVVRLIEAEEVSRG